MAVTVRLDAPINPAPPGAPLVLIATATGYGLEDLLITDVTTGRVVASSAGSQGVQPPLMQPLPAGYPSFGPPTLRVRAVLPNPGTATTHRFQACALVNPQAIRPGEGVGQPISDMIAAPSSGVSVCSAVLTAGWLNAGSAAAGSTMPRAPLAAQPTVSVAASNVTLA